MELRDKKVIVVGGSSGIGSAVAKAAFAKGADVTIASRSEDKLKKAAVEIGDSIAYRVLDARKEEDVMAFFDSIDMFDHLVCTIHDADPSIMSGGFVPIDQIKTDVARAWMEAKYWGQYFCAKYAVAKLAEKGSITLSAGISMKRYLPLHAAFAPGNAAIACFGWLLAQEIGPKRVNVVAPGFVRTPVSDFMPEPDRNAFYDKIAKEALPVKHVATPEEVAPTYIYLMECDYQTGAVITCDGGIWSMDL